MKEEADSIQWLIDYIISKWDVMKEIPLIIIGLPIATWFLTKLYYKGNLAKKDDLINTLEKQIDRAVPHVKEQKPNKTNTDRKNKVVKVKPIIQPKINYKSLATKVLESSEQEPKLSDQLRDWLRKQKEADNSEIDIMCKYYESDFPEIIMEQLNKHCKNYNHPNSLIDLNGLLLSLELINN